MCQEVASDAQIADPEEEIELGDHQEAMNEEENQHQTPPQVNEAEDI